MHRVTGQALKGWQTVLPQHAGRIKPQNGQLNVAVCQSGGEICHSGSNPPIQRGHLTTNLEET